MTAQKKVRKRKNNVIQDNLHFTNAIGILFGIFLVGTFLSFSLLPSILLASTAIFSLAVFCLHAGYMVHKLYSTPTTKKWGTERHTLTNEMSREENAALLNKQPEKPCFKRTVNTAQNKNTHEKKVMFSKNNQIFHPLKNSSPPEISSSPRKESVHARQP